MAAAQGFPADPRTFEPQLFAEDDDAEDLAYKRVLDGLISQASSPPKAAAEMDALVVAEANARLDALQRRNPPFRLTTEEEEQGLTPRLVGPNPSGWLDMIIASIAKICSAFPPAHPVQDALVEFLRELRDMPKHQVPDGDYTAEESDGVVHIRTFTLWPIGEPSVDYLAERFRREAEEIAYPFSHVETPGSETQQRWSNLQSFVARLTVSGLIDCSRVTALGYILSSSPTYPDLAARKTGGAARLAGDLIAASHWLDDDRARRWVYERCMTAENNNKERSTWNKENWANWKEQLGFLAEIEGFPAQARDLALSLRSKMEAEG